MPSSLAELIEMSLIEEFRTTIKINQIIHSKEIISNNPTSTHQLFQILCAMNLINAALKKREFKKEVYYGMLKPKVSKLLKFILENNIIKFDIEFYIDQLDHCAYIEVYGLQFSFHNITIDEKLKEFINSSQNKPKIWKGIRLQNIAGELFDYSINKKSLYHKS